MKYPELRVNKQLNKLKSEARHKTGTGSRMTRKNFLSDELPHKLLMTIRQKSKIRNAFKSNISSAIKLSKAEISKVVQSGGFLGAFSGKLAGPI